MASFKALCLAGVASLAATAATQAADLLQPPPAPIYAPPPPAVVGSGWYLRGDVGATDGQLRGGSSEFASYVPDFASQGASVSEGALIGAGVGYQFNGFFRADVTGEYRFGAKYHAVETASGCGYDYYGNPGPCADQYSAKINSGLVLVNGYVDLGTYFHATPYVGAGVGVAFNQFSGLTDYNLNYYGQASGYAPGSTRTSFAWALMAGIAYDLTPNLKLDFGYRFADLGQLASAPIVCSNSSGCPFERQKFHLTSNDIRLGLRYQFADLVPYQQPPLIRKY